MDDGRLAKSFQCRKAVQPGEGPSFKLRVEGPRSAANFIGRLCSATHRAHSLAFGLCMGRPHYLMRPVDPFVYFG